MWWLILILWLQMVAGMHIPGYEIYESAVVVMTDMACNVKYGLTCQGVDMCSSKICALALANASPLFLQSVLPVSNCSDTQHFPNLIPGAKIFDSVVIFAFKQNVDLCERVSDIGVCHGIAECSGMMCDFMSQGQVWFQSLSLDADCF